MEIDNKIAFILAVEISNSDPFIFIPNPGNAGDALINLANYNLFRKFGFAFFTAEEDNKSIDLSKKIVVYGPARGLNRNYSKSLNIIEKCLPIAQKLILLPCTIRDNEDIIKIFDQKVIVMSRDHETFDHVRKYAKSSVQVIDSEDTALTLDAAKIIRTPPGNLKYIMHQLRISKYHGRIATMQTLRWLYLYTKHFFNKLLGRKEINIFRNDAERTHSPPHDNLDISAYLENNDMSEIGARITSYRFLKFINLYSTVNTNRLHAAIGALLLGKYVNFYDNSYGKNLVIYERSLKERYPGRVTWHSTRPFHQ